jgi:hypothetical protein
MFIIIHLYTVSMQGTSTIFICQFFCFCFRKLHNVLALQIFNSSPLMLLRIRNEKAQFKIAIRIHTSFAIFIKFYVNVDPQGCISVTNANSGLRSSRTAIWKHCVLCAVHQNFVVFSCNSCTNFVHFICLWLIPHPTANLENFWIHEMNEWMNELTN